MFADLQIYLFCASLIVTILIIWFKTDAFVEYLDLLGFKKLFYIKEYKVSQDTSFAVNYPNFLMCQKNCFLSRLVSCPTCITFWLSLFCCTQIGFFNAPLLFVSSLVFYYLFEYLVNLRS